MTKNSNTKKMSKAEFERDYIDSHFPMLCGYAYNAEIISINDGKKVMRDILKKVDWIDDSSGGYPILHMKDGKELYSGDTDDFPVPTDDCGEEEIEDEEDDGETHWERLWS
jgi:hypothetical protein